MTSTSFYLSGETPTIKASAKMYDVNTGKQLPADNFMISLGTRADMQLKAPADGKTYSKRLSGVNINRSHNLHITHARTGHATKCIGSGNISYFVH